MELYTLPISGEQICNAKHWIQDATHGYKEAIRTKLIKQDAGLSTVHRILSRNKDTSERETNCTLSHTPARSSLHYTPISSEKSDYSSNSTTTRDIHIPITLSQTHTDENLGLSSCLVYNGEAWGCDAVIHAGKCNCTCCQALKFRFTVSQVRRQVGFLARPLLQPQEHYISSSYHDPEPKLCLTTAQLDSVQEESRLMPRTDIRTRRDTLPLPLCPLTRPRERHALLPVQVLLAPARSHTFLLCFSLLY